MKEISIEKFLRIIKRLLLVIIALFWTATLIVGGYSCLAKKYVYKMDHKETIFYFANKYHLSKTLVFSVIKVESSFNEKAVSEKGAIGLMQIMPSTGEYIASKLGVNNYDLKNAETNIEFGCFYLNYLLGKFDSVKTATCAYNAGEGKVEKWLKTKEYSSDGITLDVIPFKETREYLQKVEKTFLKYKKLYGKILDN